MGQYKLAAGIIAFILTASPLLAIAQSDQWQTAPSDLSLQQVIALYTQLIQVLEKELASITKNTFDSGITTQTTGCVEGPPNPQTGLCPGEMPLPANPPIYTEPTTSAPMFYPESEPTLPTTPSVPIILSGPTPYPGPGVISPSGCIEGNPNPETGLCPGQMPITEYPPLPNTYATSSTPLLPMIPE